MPFIAGSLECLVVFVLGFGNLHFNADVLAYIVSILIKHQQSQLTAHSAVAVVEGMDAQEIADEAGNQD